MVNGKIRVITMEAHPVTHRGADMRQCHRDHVGSTSMAAVAAVGRSSD